MSASSAAFLAQEEKSVGTKNVLAAELRAFFRHHYGYHGLAQDPLACAAEKGLFRPGRGTDYYQIGLPRPSGDDEFDKWFARPYLVFHSQVGELRAYR
jgi:hypothetical protein